MDRALEGGRLLCGPFPLRGRLLDWEFDFVAGGRRRFLVGGVPAFSSRYNSSSAQATGIFFFR